MTLKFFTGIIATGILLSSCIKETAPEIETGSITDIDGNTYKTVKIGDQWWMAENLKTTKYTDGTAIELIEDDALWSASVEPCYSYFNNDPVAYGSVYGVLYNFYTVIGGNLCPTGWRVPSDADWFALENFVDPSIDDPEEDGFRGTEAGKHLKSKTGWGDGSDSFGFNALAGGYRQYEGFFTELNTRTYFWTSTVASTNWSWFRSLKNDSKQISRSKYVKRMGCYVRCVKDTVER